MYKLIPIDIYKRGILIWFGKKEELLRYIKKRHPMYYDDVNDIVNTEDYLAITGMVKQDILIYSEEVPELPIVIHEICHAAMMLLEKVGIEASDGNGEPYAYLVEYVCRKVLEWLNVSPCDVQSQSSLDVSSHS